MMNSLVLTGRLLSRALWNGISNYSSVADPNVSRKREPCMLSAVCGFPKDFAKSVSIRGKFGDDAWFTAKSRTYDILGVADGVGGWQEYGIDPGEFSLVLMKTCERLITCGRVTNFEPCSLLSRSYYELRENKQSIVGSSTACIVVLNKETCTVQTANIGDSGFVVVRAGKVVHKSEEQQHYFNTPFQLALPPPSHAGSVISDRPESADTSNFAVEDGDVILLATDGVFDNVPDTLLISELCRVQGEKDLVKIQTVANTIALMARKLAFDQRFMSPFAKSARENGIYTVGGKPDDITVLLATVAL